jgi:hypothetical protein
MIACTHSENSNEYQIGMAFFLLASGSSRAEFDVLQHAGLCTSYPTALNNLKKLSKERLEFIVQITRTRAWMLLWDNINMAFRVGEQRLSNRSTFENGTTSTLVVLHDVAYGELKLDLLPPVVATRPILDYTADDLRPTPQQAAELQQAMIWHVRDILLSLYPALRARLGDTVPSLPDTMCIAPHKTEFHPLPAVKLDESTLEGTMDFFDFVFDKTLKLTPELLRAHGVVFGGGDLLSNLLAEKVSD